MASADPPLDVSCLVRGEHYATHGYPHETWSRLRKDSPVHRCEIEGFDPFWAITRYEDLVTVSRQPRLFRNAPRLSVFPKSFPRRQPQDTARSLLNMDPPEHGKYRAIVNRSFTPQGLRPLLPHVQELTASIVDEVARSIVSDALDRAECEFVTDVAARLPLAVIMELLGVPRDDWRLLFQWSNEAIGPGDPEYRGDRSAFETAERAMRSFFEYFAGYVAERRSAPREDLVSLLVQSRIDGRPIEDFEILSYCFLLAVAGNETTRNATSGGMLALLENPSEMTRLRDDTSMLPAAVEEILRWTSPVIHFCRTAAADGEVRGRKIGEGDLLVLFYPSANRDEEIFPDPFRFDVTRAPNDHVAFGIGEHFCLGANLARMELRAVLAECLSRMEDIEPAGPVERLRSSFVGGIKRMPLRFRAR